MTENFSLSAALASNSSVDNTNIADLHCFAFTNSVVLKVLMIAAYSAVMATSVLGNYTLAFVFYKNKSMRNTINCCIMNMVFADLLVTLVYMPRMVARIVDGLEWKPGGAIGQIVCKIVSLSQEISICVSVLTVVIIAFERFIAVVFPLRVAISKKLSLGLLFGTWIVSLAVRSPMFYAVKTVRFPSGELGCFWIHDLSFPTEEARKIYHTFMFIAFYGLPLLCIITLYTVIFIFLRRRQGLIGNATRNRALATNKKVTRMMLMVITAFLLCWLLYFTAMPLEEFYGFVVSCEVHFLRIFLGHVNSACNPVICLVFSENYRNGIRRGVLGKKNLKRLPKHALRNSVTRDRSVSNIALLHVKTLHLDPSVQRSRGITNESFKCDENHCHV